MKTAFSLPRSKGIGFRYLRNIGSALAIALALIGYMAPPAYAGDLGGSCCTDLEDRVAELEATTANKGNRKISLRVYGVIDEAIMHLDGGRSNGKWSVGQNSNVESFIGVAGEAVIAPQIKAGYVLEIGVGNDDNRHELSSPFNNDGTGTYTRRSFAYLSHERLGTVSVGLVNQATDGIAEMSLANTQVAARMLSMKPIIGPNLGDALDLFDGTRTNSVRYDSPTLWGAKVSASWSAGGLGGAGVFGGESTSDSWDVALRWAGEGYGFKAAAGVGYREGMALPGYGTLGSISYGGVTEIDPHVISASGSIKHVASGLFVNGAIGNYDLGGFLGNQTSDMTAWTVQGGIEQRFFPVGVTTIYGEYADSDTMNFGSNSIGLGYWGIGAVQHLDNAATDLYISYRRYDGNSLGFGSYNGFDEASNSGSSASDFGLFMAGAKVEF